MWIRRSLCALLAAPVVGSVASAQLPAPPAALPPGVAPPVVSSFPAVSSPLLPASPFSGPLSAAPAAVGIAPAPPPPGPPTLGQFLGLSYQQREYRQRRLARTPIGQLREKIQTPLSKVTGGLIPPFPPKTPSLAELQAPGPVGAAAKAKLDRETAIDRIKAVEYLGTVDCHYWPEAEDALVGALRSDRNEWVRLAAAQTLGKGCCCTKKTITALSMTASCSMEDGNPIEKSPQVIAAAQAALARCLAMACACQPSFEAYEAIPVNPIDGNKKEGVEGVEQASYSKAGPAGSEKSSGGLAASQMVKVGNAEFYERVSRRPWGYIIATAKNVVATTPQVPAHVLLAGANRDLELSGIDPTADAGSLSPRPANLLDMLLGDDAPEVKPVSLALAVRPEVGALHGPRVATAAPAASPAMAVTSGRTAVTTKTVVRQAPAPSKGITPVGYAPASVPQPMPMPTPQPAGKSVAAPAAATVASARADRVIGMLAKKADARQVEAEVDQLTADDFRTHTGLTSAMLRTAEEHADVDLRSACIRSLGRGKVASPAVVGGLERLVNDRAVGVRVEAAVTLNAIRTGK